MTASARSYKLLQLRIKREKPIEMILTCVTKVFMDTD